MLESLGGARLSSNSGWNGDLPGKGLFLWCQHRKAKSESREWTKSSLGSSVHFFDSFFFFPFGWVYLLGSKFCFYFGTNDLLLRDLQGSILNLRE